MHFEFVQKRYEEEFARKDKIREQVGTPVSALVVLGGLLATMAGRFTYDWEFWTYFFVLCGAVAGGCFLLSLFNFFNAYHSQPYREVGPLSKFQETYKSLPTTLATNDRKMIEYYERLGNTDAAARLRTTPTDAVAVFKQMVEDQLIAFTDFNQASNVAKSKFLEKGTNCLWVLIVFVAAAAIPYAVNQNLKPPKPQILHIDNLPIEKDVTNGR
jgi:hypothetical protein